MIISTLSISANALSVVMTKEAQEAEKQAKNTVNNFLSYLEYGSASTYSYIDMNNSELYGKLQDRLKSYSTIDSEIKKISKKGDTYEIEVKISAESEGTKVSGITSEFKVKEINGSYKIVETNFFDVTSVEFVFGIVAGVFGIVLLVLGCIFGSIIIVIIIVIVIVIVVKKNKKK